MLEGECSWNPLEGQAASSNDPGAASKQESPAGSIAPRDGTERERAFDSAIEEASGRHVKPPKGFDLIIFDCDGVLVDSEVLSMRAHQSQVRRTWRSAFRRAVGAMLRPQTGRDIRIIEKAVGRVAPPEVHAELRPRTKALFAAELKPTPTPGLVEFLEVLDAPRCVASSSNPERIRFRVPDLGSVNPSPLGLIPRLL